MDQQAIFEYLDKLQLQLTDPIQKQLEYYHNKKNMIASKKKLTCLKFQSPQVIPLLSEQLHIRKALSQQTIEIPQLDQGWNINYHKKSHFEKKITLQ